MSTDQRLKEKSFVFVEQCTCTCIIIYKLCYHCWCAYIEKTQTAASLTAMISQPTIIFLQISCFQWTFHLPYPLTSSLYSRRSHWDTQIHTVQYTWAVFACHNSSGTVPSESRLSKCHISRHDPMMNCVRASVHKIFFKWERIQSESGEMCS